MHPLLQAFVLILAIALLPEIIVLYLAILVGQALGSGISFIVDKLNG